MATRLAVFSAVLSVAIAAPLMPACAFAQEQAEIVPQVENSRFQFAGVINADSTLIRSGPGENYYPTMRLDKGTPVTVVGIKFEWLKILPPEGSYSLISRAFVQRDEGGNTGTVIGDNVRVRAGGKLTPLKTSIQCMLNKGEQVTIVGEQDEYYEIKPPAGAYLYVSQKLVSPVRQLTEKPVADSGPASGGANSSSQMKITTGPKKPADEAAANEQETKAAREAADVAAEFDRLESLLKAALEKPLDAQPIAELIEGYEKILKSEYLSVPMRRIAEIRLIGLRGKAERQQELLAMRKQQQETLSRIEQLRAERKALEEKMAGNIVVYTAVGTLQASTLQVGEGTLYRMVDPNTSRTMCYVRSSDPTYVSYTGKFVGVRGELLNDPQLNLQVVNAGELEVVDPQKVNKGITAQVSPPSFLTQRAEQKSTENN